MVQHNLSIYTIKIRPYNNSDIPISQFSGVLESYFDQKRHAALIAVARLE